MYELSQENVGNIPMFQNQTTDVSLYVALGMLKGTIEKNERKRRERRDREGRKEGTLIINATGHRPFKIKRSIAINKNISFFFLSPVFFT